MADRCVFFHEILEIADARQRTYCVLEPEGLGMACLDVQLRRGEDWYFARRWIPTRHGQRELYRTLDRLDGRGFRFDVTLKPRASPPLPPPPVVETMRASELRKGLSEEEQRMHRDLFPDESALLDRGYDWDLTRVWQRGELLRPDPYGRLLETDGDVLYEWVNVPEEFTWRRYPLGRVRLAPLTVPGR